MGTRAVYTFRNEFEAYHVYKHWDGYPSGAAGFLTHALAYAWKLPRFEPDEFAAAFIAGNKKIHEGGDIRLLNTGDVGTAAPGDIEYWYEVWQAPNGQLIVRATAVDNWKGKMKIEKTVFYGRLVDFIEQHDAEAYMIYRTLYPSTSQKAA
jgi:hypothetical protein